MIFSQDLSTALLEPNLLLPNTKPLADVLLSHDSITHAVIPHGLDCDQLIGVSGVTHDVAVAESVAHDAHGLGWAYSGAPDSITSIGTSSIFSGDFTFVIVYRNTDFFESDNWFFTEGDSVNTGAFAGCVNEWGRLKFYYAPIEGGSLTLNSSDRIDDGNVHVAVITAKHGDVCELYIDGVFHASTTHPGGTFAPTNTSIGALVRGATKSHFSQIDFYLAAWGNAKINASEACALCDDVYAMFDAPGEVLFSAGGAGGGGLSLTRSVSEATHYSETPRRSLELNRDKPETTHVLASALETLSLSREQASLVHISDLSDTSLGLLRSIAYGVNTTEGGLHALSALLVEIIDEVNQIPCTSTPSRKMTQAIQDVLQSIQGLVSAKSIHITHNDTVSTPELAYPALALIRDAVEITRIQELLIHSSALTRIVSSVVDLQGTVIHSLSASLIELINESAQVSESSIEVLSALLLQVVGEVVRPGESVANVVSQLLIKLAGEITTVSESKSHSQTLNRQATELVNIAGALTSSMRLHRNVQDPLSIVEAAVLARKLIHALAETTRILDAPDYVRMITQVAQETLQVSETVAQKIGVLLQTIGGLVGEIEIVPALGGELNVVPALKGEIKIN